MSFSVKVFAKFQAYPKESHITTIKRSSSVSMVYQNLEYDIHMAQQLNLLVIQMLNG